MKGALNSHSLPSFDPTAKLPHVMESIAVEALEPGKEGIVTAYACAVVLTVSEPNVLLGTALINGFEDVPIGLANIAR